MRRGITQELLFNNLLQLYSPEFVKNEIEKHKKEIMKKGNCKEQEFDIIISIIFSRITIVVEAEYIKYKTETLEFVPDINDWPFLALAKHLTVPVWTYDSAISKKQNRVTVVTTSELVMKFK
ncbi:hypothetical protein HZC07_00435 [Candidatus Micrarchaeota archaeon]|nr:hypothetical protein [Candidatus Micrarchaeota archaeon]